MRNQSAIGPSPRCDQGLSRPMVGSVVVDAQEDTNGDTSWTRVLPLPIDLFLHRSSLSLFSSPSLSFICHLSLVTSCDCDEGSMNIDCIHDWVESQHLSIKEKMEVESLEGHKWRMRGNLFLSEKHNTYQNMRNREEGMVKIRKYEDRFRVILSL